MILSIGGPTLALVASLAIAQQPAQSGAPDYAPTVQRLAATVRLAAQEYRLGVSDGKVIAQPEVEEARLFLTEARRTAGLLPPSITRYAFPQIDSVLAIVAATGSPDSVAARASVLADRVARDLGITLDVVPANAPSLARGAEVFQTNCASCHGTLGRGDGPAAAGIQPPPANLADAGALIDASPLSFYEKITIGVAGTAMPAFETRLSREDRWAAAVYATLFRLPPPQGEVPPALSAFPTSARMSDRELADAVAPLQDPAGPRALAAVAAVRNYQLQQAGGGDASVVFDQVRRQLDSALRLARAGHGDAASTVAFDAYMVFEQVEPTVRAKENALAGELETSFAAFRSRAAGGATDQELSTIHNRLLADLEKAERTMGDQLSAGNLVLNSFVILVREGLEAILILGALVAMLAKMGATQRKRDVHIGAGAAVAASLLTAVVLETLITITPASREALEGVTMLVAVVMLFYVSYWLLSKMEVAKWNRFVKGKVEDALTSGSALALASVAFLAVYREGFETVLFYKALFVAGGSGGAMPVVAGILAGSVVLVAVYYAINRFGVKIPLRPFFAFTSAFLYYMAFVFAGKGIAELQEGGLVSTTLVPWGPRVPQVGIYPTVETMAAQGVLLALFAFALVWTFIVLPRRLKLTRSLVPEGAPAQPAAPGAVALSPDVNRDFVRSLERMDADLAELRAEVERLRQKLGGEVSRKQ